MTTSQHSIKDVISDTALESFNMGLKVGKALTHERYQAALREVSVENELGACIYLADLQETLEMFYPDHDTPVS